MFCGLSFLSCHCFGKGNLSVFILTFVALLAVRTSLAAFTDVIAFYYFIVIFGFSFTVIGVIQPFAVWAGEVISDLIIAEVFKP